MRIETVDKDSGAILFKKDEDSLMLEEVYKKLENLERYTRRLEKRIKSLEEKESSL